MTSYPRTKNSKYEGYEWYEWYEGVRMYEWYELVRMVRASTRGTRWYEVVRGGTRWSNNSLKKNEGILTYTKSKYLIT